MKEPTLVIMAAGMGSRYGGLKQMDPIDDMGHVIMDYSLYDARRAGFKRVVFITKQADVLDFEEKIASRMRAYFDVEVVLQEIDDLPEGISVPKDRKKPWGTAHAIYSCRHVIDGPFAVINADDYYGIHAYKAIYDYLATHTDGEKYAFAMVGFSLKNTVTEHGHVARGVCETKDDQLIQITERTRIEKRENGICFSEDDGNSWESLSDDTVVSMNLWGFSESMMKEIIAQFPNFLNENLTNNPLRAEYFLPSVVERLLKEQRASVEVLRSYDKWYGVTYKEDKPQVVEAIKKLRDDGAYPASLWE